MKIHQTLVLLGMPGSGKSTLGKALAAKTGLPFADLDHLLEAEEGLSIPQLFEVKGEAYFRERESELLKQVLNRAEPMVLATGGGTPCFFDNMAQIRQLSFSIYLEVGWALLAQRLAQQAGQRPLLKDFSEASFVESLQEKFSWRIPFYQQARLCLTIEEGQTPQRLAAALVNEIKK